MKSCEISMGIHEDYECNTCGILHNDLSKDNIMLHVDKLDVVYIGMCNWGEAEHLEEVSHHCMVL